MAVAIVAARRWATVALAIVAAAVAVRWGTTSLEGVAGAQGVLGPAALTGPKAAALSQLLAAVAVVLVAPARTWGAAAVGVTGALLAFGPAGGDGIPVRLASTVVAVGLALLARHLPGSRHPVAAVVALAALALAAAGT